MLGTAHILRSKVARRIFFLFVVGAILPILALSVVTSMIVSRQVGDQTRDRLERTAKLVAMEIAGRLSRVEHEVRAVGTALHVAGIDAAPNVLAPLDGVLGEHVLSVTLSVNGTTRPLLGDLPPALDGALHAPIESPRLSVVPSPAGEPSIFLSVPVDARAPERGTMYAELDPDYLWSRREGMDLPSNSSVVVLDARRNTLHESIDGDLRIAPDIAQLLGSISQGDIEWAPDGSDHIAGLWTLFLKPQYGYAGLTVIVSEPRGVVLAPVLRINRLLPLVVFLCLIGVLLMSVIQIRRQLVPIVSLREGTRRIAESDFETRVEVSSGDEFQELAESFNAMAGRLSRQFRTLRKLSETDRSLLSTLDERKIMRTVLLRMPDHVSCDCIGVTLADEEDGVPRFRTRFRWTDGPEESIRWVATTDETERDLLARGRAGLLRFSGSDLPKHLRALFGGSVQECVVLPMLREGVEGFVALGYRQRAEIDDEALIEARRLAEQVAVALSNAHLVRQLEQANRETLYALARAVDAASPWTAGHSERVSELALRLARKVGLPEGDIAVLHKGALLHDVGKIGVPNDVLDKPGRLTDEEMQVMRDHVRIGARILEPISAYREQLPIVLYHHERWDGNGYPDGLAGTGIPYMARLLCVADVYDALSSSRPYRAPWPREKVLDFVRDGAGTQFDPDLAGAFVEMMEAEDAGDVAAAGFGDVEESGPQLVTAAAGGTAR